MPSFTNILAVAGLAVLAQAQSYTPLKGDVPTWGPLLAPNQRQPVTRGQTFTVTWDPETRNVAGQTVALVLCNGPGSNCVLQPQAIATGLPANAKSYTWQVPCSVTPGTQSTATGHGMVIIVEQTGEYQYSEQFSVLEGSTCGADSTTTTGSSSSSSSSGPSRTITILPTTVIPPPASSSSSSSSGSSSSIVITMTNTIVPTSAPGSSTTVQTSTVSRPATGTTAATSPTTTFPGAANKAYAPGALVIAAAAALLAF